MGTDPSLSADVGATWISGALGKIVMVMMMKRSNVHQRLDEKKKHN
jgi:hypothetical protein